MQWYWAGGAGPYKAWDTHGWGELGWLQVENGVLGWGWGPGEGMGSWGGVRGSGNGARGPSPQT